MSNLVKLIKDFRYLLTLIGVGSTGGWFNWDSIVTYSESNFITMLILTSLITLIFIYVLYMLNMKDHARIDIVAHRQHEVQLSTQEQIKEMILKSDQQALRSEVKQALKDYSDVDTISFDTTIKYILGLEKRRIELCVNSYTEEMLKILLGKIVYEQK